MYSPSRGTGILKLVIEFLRESSETLVVEMYARIKKCVKENTSRNMEPLLTDMVYSGIFGGDGLLRLVVVKDFQ